MKQGVACNYPHLCCRGDRLFLQILPSGHSLSLLSNWTNSNRSHSLFVSRPKMTSNKSVIYKRYTPYLPVPGEHLTVETRVFDQTAEPPTGGLTIKNTHLSLDPYQRGQMRAPGDAGSYSIPWVEGQPAVVMTVATVIRSDAPGCEFLEKSNSLSLFEKCQG